MRRITNAEYGHNDDLRRQRVNEFSFLIFAIFRALLRVSPDACSTRSTPKARSSYISQLQAQQQAQRPIPRLVPHAPQQPSSYRAQPPASSVPVQTPFAAVPAPSVPTVSDTDLTTQRPNVTFQTYTCPEAYAKWYCLNGASCFSLKIGESILYNCECASGYVGQRCEFKDLDGTYLRKYLALLFEFLACFYYRKEKNVHASFSIFCFIPPRTAPYLHSRKLRLVTVLCRRTHMCSLMSD